MVHFPLYLYIQPSRMLPKLDHLVVGVRFLAVARVDTGFGTHSASFSMRVGGSYTGADETRTWSWSLTSIKSVNTDSEADPSFWVKDTVLFSRRYSDRKVCVAVHVHLMPWLKSLTVYLHHLHHNHPSSILVHCVLLAQWYIFKLTLNWFLKAFYHTEHCVTMWNIYGIQGTTFVWYVLILYCVWCVLRPYLCTSLSVCLYL